MQTRVLGKDGPEVPVVCLGGVPIAGGMGSVPEEQAIATVQAAIDAGMGFIDTAEAYWSSESLIGKAIKGRRHQVFLATKVSGDDHSPEHLARALENSLRALGADYIDLYQLHRYSPTWPIGPTMENLVRLRDSGKIRYTGISNFTAEQTLEALTYGPVYSSQPRYNMLYREAESSVLPCCLQNGVGVIPHSTLAKGLLSGKYRPGHRPGPDDSRNEVDAFIGETFERVSRITDRLSEWASAHGRDLVQLAIAWTLAHPAVTSAIVGARTPEQVYLNARAADWRLSEGDLQEIDGIQGDLRLPGAGEWLPSPADGVTV